MSIVIVDPKIAREKFLKKPFELKHTLADNALFTLPRLVQLAKSMPRDSIEYNSGKVAVGVKPEDVPKIDMAAEDVIASIEKANAWMVIKFVERDLTSETFLAAPAAGESSKVELTRTCLEAHELLIALHPGNAAKFKDAARFFAEELRALGGSDTSAGR